MFNFLIKLIFKFFYLLTYPIRVLRCRNYYATVEVGSHIPDPFDWSLGFFSFTWALLKLANCYKEIHKLSALISSYSYRFRLHPDQTLRRLLRDLELGTPSTNKPGHSHPFSSAYRSFANKTIDETILRYGYQPYSISSSIRDNGKGNRFYYTEKDFGLPYQNDTLEEDSIITMVDVDYYCDMNAYLSVGKPILLYTIIPESVAFQGPDYAFTIKDDEIRHQVNGGAKYSHRLWDYERDTVSVLTPDDTLIVYDVERRKLPGDPHHQLVLLDPVVAVPAPFWIHVEPHPLTRMKFHIGNGVNSIMDPVRDIVSCGIAGKFVCADIPVKTYEMVKSMFVESPKPVVGTLERPLFNKELMDAPEKASILYQCFKRTVDSPHEHASTSEARSYQVLGPLTHENPKPAGRQVHTPLVDHPDLYPSDSFNNDLASVKGRVLKTLNRKEPSTKYKTYKKEFIQFLVPDNIKGKGVPLTYEEVDNLQRGRLQRNRFKQAIEGVLSHAKCKIKAFVKKEPMAGIKDPRNISTVPIEHNIILSTFTYAFKLGVLFKQRWFAPGLIPADIARRVQEVAKNGCICRDFSRFDGHVSKFLDSVPDEAMVQWTAKQYRGQLVDRLQREKASRGITRNGFLYDPEYSRRSGSPCTTNSNTVITAFLGYCAARESGFNPKTSYRKLGLYCGDDGVDDPTIPIAAHQGVSEDVGMKLKAFKCQPGEPVEFCSRVFIDPRSSLDSYQCVERQLRKSHLSLQPPNITDSEACHYKYSSFVLTDAKTPILGSLARKMVEINTPVAQHKKPKAERAYVGGISIVAGPWPQEDEGAIRRVFLQQTAWSPDMIARAEEEISKIKCLNFEFTPLPVEQESSLPGQLNTGDVLVDYKAVVAKRRNNATKDHSDSSEKTTPPKEDQATGSYGNLQDTRGVRRSEPIRRHPGHHKDFSRSKQAPKFSRTRSSNDVRQIQGETSRLQMDGNVLGCTQRRRSRTILPTRRRIGSSNQPLGHDVQNGRVRKKWHHHLREETNAVMDCPNRQHPESARRLHSRSGPNTRSRRGRSNVLELSRHPRHTSHGDHVPLRGSDGSSRLHQSRAGRQTPQSGFRRPDEGSHSSHAGTRRRTQGRVSRRSGLNLLPSLTVWNTNTRSRRLETAV
ncbi:hypothetical protein [Beihai sphaeromadae virus 2]|uniref:hypothetical protein n=1 Tax=Beihai sphaeromadae virus 2 TaxID=1922708 RepID=UPI000909A17D|nr:hypothetical protein [Beihai sphaeromadae virus 2]APG76143.1 hypothetical protein [Beihai sphaeromadae virus 2]